MLHFGEQLKTVRQARGYHLDYVEDITGINRTYLQILEDGRYDAFPEENITIEIVSRYAAVLGICVADAVDDCRASLLAYHLDPAIQNAIFRPRPENAVCKALGHAGSDSVLPGASPEARSASQFIMLPGFPVRNVAAAAVFLGLSLWLGISVVTPYISAQITAYEAGSSVTQADYDRQRLDDLKQVQPSRGDESLLAMAGDASVPAKGVGTAAAEATIDLELRAEEDCWVKTTVDGEVEFEGILSKGQSLNMVAQEVIKLKTSSAGSLSLSFNGEALKPMGEINEVIEKEFR